MYYTTKIYVHIIPLKTCKMYYTTKDICKMYYTTKDIFKMYYTTKNMYYTTKDICKTNVFYH